MVLLTLALSDSAAGRGLAAPEPAAPSAVAADRPGGLIAFTTWVANDAPFPSELFTVRSNGHGVRQLTHRQHVRNFAWGPGGRHLLYSAQHGIWIMRWDGSHRTRLVGTDDPGAVGPLWSPDGKKFLFSTFSRGAYRLSVYTFADHTITPVGNPISNFGGASWSPDSQHFVFAALDDNSRYQLWSDSLATGTVQQLTSFRRGEQGSGAGQPAWSPGGGRILFVLDVIRCQSGCFLTNLWSVAPDGTGLQQITFSPRHGEHQAAWAPNGNRFVDASSTEGDYSLPSDYTALVVRHPDGTTIRRIHARGDMLPSWSPNGRWIVAVRPAYGATGGDYANKPGLWVVRANGTDAHRILKSGLLEAAPAWEPTPG